VRRSTPRRTSSATSPYVARVTARADQTRLASDNRVEIDRARDALERAEAGRIVAVVSGGDPGVFAMAAAVFEVVDEGPLAWRGLDIHVIPGVSAMQAAAARLGAPLGHDFCAISVGLAKSIGREKEEIILATLDTVDPAQVDMSTLVMIGASGTKHISRENARDWIYTARAAS